MRTLWLWAPLLVYAALIFYLSGRPYISWAVPYPDYLLHTIEYLVLALLVARAMNGGLLRVISPRLLWFAFLLCTLYAISDEVHQMFVPHRYAAYTDVLADTFGAALGLLAIRFGQRLVLRRGTA